MVRPFCGFPMRDCYQDEGLLSSTHFVDVALYTRHRVRHSPFSGQFGFGLKLHLRLMLSFVLFSTLGFFDDVSNIGSAAIT